MADIVRRKVIQIWLNCQDKHMADIVRRPVLSFMLLVAVFSSGNIRCVCVALVLWMYRDEKAKWIRAKYEDKEFLPPPPYVDVAMPQVL